MLVGGESAIELGHDPWRGALEHRHRRDLVGNRGNDLDRAGAGADDSDVASGQIERFVPQRGVDDLPGETVETLDIGDRGMVEHPHRRHQHARRQRLAAAEHQPPQRGVVVPDCLIDRGVERDMTTKPMIGDDIVEVSEDLLLPGEHPRPTGIGRKGERIKM